MRRRALEIRNDQHLFDCTSLFILPHSIPKVNRFYRKRRASPLFFQKKDNLPNHHFFPSLLHFDFIGKNGKLQSKIAKKVLRRYDATPFYILIFQIQLNDNANKTATSPHNNNPSNAPPTALFALRFKPFFEQTIAAMIPMIDPITGRTNPTANRPQLFSLASLRLKSQW